MKKLPKGKNAKALARTLYYNRFRYYSPDEGMYISQDPIRLRGNNPTLYAYVKDPNKWVDRLGLAATCEEEIQSLPEFEGKTKEEIEQEALNRGYTKIKDNNSGVTYVKQTDDGQYAVVRIDPANPRSSEEKADSRAHAHKETAGGYSGTHTDGTTTKVYTDAGIETTKNDYHSTHIPIKTD